MEKGLATAAITIVTEAPVNSNMSDSMKLPNLPKPTGSKPRNDEDVRVVDISEYKQAAACLADAFAKDEVAKYFLDTPDRAHWTEQQRWDLHVDIMEYITYAHCLKGLVTTVGKDFGAVALWMPPGKNMDDTLTMFRSGMWRLYYQLSREGKKRFFTEFLPLMHDTKASILRERDNNSWYLVYLGTKPAARGKGYARKLITDVTDIADRDGRATYLESSNEVNVKIYGKMGFEVARRVWLQRCIRKPVILDIMVREPQRKVIGEKRN